MVEALSGQIYLVVVVARLVSIWGQERSTTFRLRRRRERTTMTVSIMRASALD